MKSLTALLVATWIASGAADWQCPQVDLGDQLVLLSPFLRDPSLQSCTKDSGTDLFSSAKRPTNEDIKRMCKTPSCQPWVKKLVETSLPNCDFVVGKSRVNILNIRDQIKDQCNDKGKNPKTPIPIATKVKPSQAACSSSEMDKYTETLRDPSLAACRKESGYGFMSPAGVPDEQQLAKMCASSACKKFAGLIKKQAPSDCVLKYKQRSVNAKHYVEQLENCEHCNGLEIGKYIAVVEDPSMEACRVESGFRFMPPSGQPDNALLKQMCAGASCKTLVNLIAKESPMDCRIKINGNTLNAKQLVDQVATSCTP